MVGCAGFWLLVDQSVMHMAWMWICDTGMTHVICKLISSGCESLDQQSVGV